MSTLNVGARYVALFLQASSYAGLVLTIHNNTGSIFRSATTPHFPLSWKPEIVHEVLTRSRFIVLYSWISSSFPRPPAKRAVAIAMINAFSQLGNVAGSYVWNLKANGFRKSYGIVTAMFGATIVGCLIFRIVLSNLNKKLEEQQRAVDTEPDRAEEVMNQADESMRMQKGFRYLV